MLLRLTIPIARDINLELSFPCADDGPPCYECDCYDKCGQLWYFVIFCFSILWFIASNSVATIICFRTGSYTPVTPLQYLVFIPFYIWAGTAAIIISGGIIYGCAYAIHLFCFNGCVRKPILP